MMAFVLRYALPLKALAIVALVGLAYWWAYDNGVGAERQRWETASVVEQNRQTVINDAAREASEEAARLLLEANEQRDELVRRLSNEARSDPDAGRACLGPAGVMRLNSLSD